MKKNEENTTTTEVAKAKSNKGFAAGMAVGAIGSLAATVIFEGIMMARSIKRCRDKSEQFAKEINEAVQAAEDQLVKEVKAEYGE